MEHEAETESMDSLLLRLTPQQYAVTQMGATEPPFTGQYWDHHERGTYRCVCCGEPIFQSESKYDSGSGWPSFARPLSEERIDTRPDHSLGMERIEVRCSKCGAHLGHVFDDGPEPEGNRYCINSLALDFEPVTEGEQEPRSVDG